MMEKSAHGEKNLRSEPPSLQIFHKDKVVSSLESGVASFKISPEAPESEPDFIANTSSSVVHPPAISVTHVQLEEDERLKQNHAISTKSLEDTEPELFLATEDPHDKFSSQTTSLGTDPTVITTSGDDKDVGLEEDEDDEETGGSWITPENVSSREYPLLAADTPCSESSSFFGNSEVVFYVMIYIGLIYFNCATSINLQ